MNVIGAVTAGTRCAEDATNPLTQRGIDMVGNLSRQNDVAPAALFSLEPWG
jgi:hypothetical protein